MQGNLKEWRAAPHRQNFAADDSSLPTPWLKARLRGPGAIYNAGNLLALGAGAALNLRDVWGQTGFVEALIRHLVGSPEAAWLTMAMVIFVIAGELYHRAYQSPEQAHLVAWGDLISGVAAMALTVALVLLGDRSLALVAGIMLTFGKLGSAALPMLGQQDASRVDLMLRLTVIASRLPSIAGLAVVVVPALWGAVPSEAVTLPGVMILCFFLWLWADLLLLARR